MARLIHNSQSKVVCGNFLELIGHKQHWNTFITHSQWRSKFARCGTKPKHQKRNWKWLGFDHSISHSWERESTMVIFATGWFKCVKAYCIYVINLKKTWLLVGTEFLSLSSTQYLTTWLVWSAHSWAHALMVMKSPWIFYLLTHLFMYSFSKSTNIYDYCYLFK